MPTTWTSMPTVRAARMRRTVGMLDSFFAAGRRDRTHRESGTCNPWSGHAAVHSAQAVSIVITEGRGLSGWARKS